MCACLCTAETFVWQHDEIQRELDKLVVKAHVYLYDLNRISDQQQDKANLLSTDTSVFQLVPRTKFYGLRMRLLCTLQSNCLESRSADTSTSTVRMLHEALVAIVGHGWICVTYT